GRPVHDEHLVAVKRGRHLLGVAGELADPLLRRRRRVERARLVDRKVCELVGGGEPGEALREHLDRHVAVAHDEDPHPICASSRGTSPTARPGAPLPPTSLSGRKTSHAPVAGSWCRPIRFSTYTIPAPRPMRCTSATTCSGPALGVSVPKSPAPRSTRSDIAASSSPGQAAVSPSTTAWA